jgi:glycosyltransferase involved in cell wall biosynthesis
MMRIGLVTSWLSHRSGGLHEAVSRLARSLRTDPECHVSVFGLADGGSEDITPAWGPNARAFKTLSFKSFGYAPHLAAALRKADLDLLHVHGLWMHYSVAGLSWRRTVGQPYVISPHGMLDPWALRNSGLKKQLALRAYERANLESAACLHALCGAEAEAMRSLGLRNPICIVPNGLEGLSEKRGGAPPWRERISATDKVLLYLGRLHPKKGLLNLLHGWHARRAEIDSKWHLAIAGWDQAGHEGELRRLVSQTGTEKVHFLGPLFGVDKQAAFAAADAFVLPSVSEGLPMVILEAWSHGLPVLMTPACNLPEGFAAGAAIEIGTGPDEIRTGLEGLMRMSTEQRRKMGDNGCRLIQERFLQMHCSDMMCQVYRWLLKRAPRPEHVLPGLGESATSSAICGLGSYRTSQIEGGE